jgi:hypothetical protein
MWAILPATYKGFEIHPLVFVRKHEPFTKKSDWEQGYDISVRICRPGAGPGTAESRVFRIEREHPFDQLGDARRFAKDHGERVIDGTIPGESVNDL